MLYFIEKFFNKIIGFFTIWKKVSYLFLNFILEKSDVFMNHVIKNTKITKRCYLLKFTFLISYFFVQIFPFAKHSDICLFLFILIEVIIAKNIKNENNILRQKFWIQLAPIWKKEFCFI